MEIASLLVFANIILTRPGVAGAVIQIVLGVRDKWPKSKYQNFKNNQWFSCKIWTKNTKEPVVYLYNWPLPEHHHFLKIQWEINFLTFLNTDRNASKKKFRIEIWTFSCQIWFKNQFSTLGSGQTENARIRVFAYLRIFRLTTSRSRKLI